MESILVFKVVVNSPNRARIKIGRRTIIIVVISSRHVTVPKNPQITILCTSLQCDDVHDDTIVIECLMC